ncbi:hypothetical protein GQ44DRAFT_731228 [Phaeosphaeriaceae sp. PMI808]|nr:hypothetical protein GQ44DRAFT_731228 [Phaeosphaeriaceae sp. PMI808]
MPNIIRRPRSRSVEPRSIRACDSGTRLTCEERRRIYSLSQDPGWGQRRIAKTLQLPRSTVQSALYTMTGKFKKQRNRKRTAIPPVRNSALAAVASSSAICTSPAPNIALQMYTAVQQPYLCSPTSATPTLPSIMTSIPDSHHRQPQQPALATYSWENHRLDSPEIARFDLQRFDVHEGVYVGTSLPPRPLKLPPMEPRVIYGRS